MERLHVQLGGSGEGPQFVEELDFSLAVGLPAPGPLTVVHKPPSTNARDRSFPWFGEWNFEEPSRPWCQFQWGILWSFLLPMFFWEGLHAAPWAKFHG